MRAFYVNDACCGIVKRLAGIIIEKEASIPDVCETSGISYSTLHGWFKRHSPSVCNLQSVLNTLGYELVIRKKDDV